MLIIILLKRILKRVSTCFMKHSRKTKENIRQLELIPNMENGQAQERKSMPCMIFFFTREIAAQKVVENLLATLPTYPSTYERE